MRKSLSHSNGRFLSYFAKTFLLAILLFLSGIVFGQTLANFKFENNLSSETGSVGSPIITWSGAATTYNFTSGGVTGQSLSSSANNLFLELTIATSGYKDIKVSWAGRTSNATTPGNWILSGDDGSGYGSALYTQTLTTSFANTGDISLSSSFNNKNSIKIKILLANNGSARNARIDDLIIKGTADGPTITSPTTSLTGFSTTPSAPSAQQSFNVSGSALTGNITITPPTNYEISTTNGVGFTATNPIILTQSGGTVTATPIYVRLKSGLGIGAYNGEVVNMTSTGATAKSVTLSGDVIRKTVTSAANGDWANGSTWSGGVAPTSGDNVVIANANIVTATTAVTRDSGTTTIVNGTSTLATNGTYTNNGTTTINGVFQLNAGGWVNSTSANALSYGSASTLNFNNTSNYGVDNDAKYWPTTNAPFSVNVLQGGITLNSANRTIAGSFSVKGTSTVLAGINLNSSALTLNGNTTIYEYGFFANAPTFGSASKLIYSTGTLYGRGLEWSANVAGVGYPNEVQISGNTTLNYPNTGSGAFSLPLGVAKNLTIDAGSSLYMGYGDSGNKSGSLTIGGNLVNNGNFGLGNATGGDLYLAGNWTKATTANFYPNNRAVIFNGSTQQDLTGVTTFDYLKINKSASYVNLATSSSVIINQNIDFTARFINLGASSVTLLSAATISNAGVNGYACATGNGRFVRQGVGAIVALFPVGVNLTGTYTPITLTNTTGTSDLGVNLKTPISSAPLGAVYDNSKIVNLEWIISSSAATVTTVTPNWLNSTYHANGFNIANPGELGNYTTSYTTYPATLSPYTTTVAGVNLRSGLNSIVVGNQYSIIHPAPANDNCPGTALTVGASPLAGDVAGATLSTPYSNVNGYANARASDDVWYSFTTSAAGNYTVKVVGSASFDTVLELRNACGQNVALAGKDATSSGETEELVYAAAANTTYYVRVYDYDTAMPATTTFTIQVLPPPPALSTNGTTALAFSNTAPGAISPSQSFNLTGDFLTGFPSNVTVTAPLNYQVSLDNSAFVASVNVPYTTGTLSSTPIYVRFAPALSACGVADANLTFSGGGVSAPPTIALSASAIVPATTATAGTLITDTSFTANWNTVSGATGYGLDVYKKSSSSVLSEAFNNNYSTSMTGWMFNSVVAGPPYIQMANSTSSVISVAVDLTNYTSKKLNFKARTYGGINASRNVITVSISLDNGVNWQLLGTRTPLNTTLTDMAEFDLASYTGNQVKIRFQTLGAASSNGSGISDLILSGNQTISTNSYVLQNYNVGNVTSYNVTGLAADTQYYYVVRGVTSSCASINSNEISVKTNNTVVWNAGAWSNTAGPSATLNGIIRSSYIVGSDATQPIFTVKDLTVESTGLLEIKANQNITVTGKITTADEKIIVDSDGSLLQTNMPATNDNTGIIIVNREAKMSKTDYTYWSTPVAQQRLLHTSGGTNTATHTIGGFSQGTPNNSISEYNEPDDKFKATADAFFVPAKSYAIRGKNTYAATAPLTSDVLQFKGVSNNGVYLANIQKSKNTYLGSPAVEYTHGYNMIGNPYPSNIDFIKFYNLDQGNGTLNSSLIKGKAWFWTNVSPTTTQGGSKYGGNNYATITLAGGTSPTSFDSATGTPTPNQFIKVGQGFIVEMLGAPPVDSEPKLTGQLKFDNTVRTNNNTGHFYNAKIKENEINRYWLKLVSPENIANTILVAHMDGATNAYDDNYDAELMRIGDDSFYSILNTKKLQIQGRSNLNIDDVVPVGVKYATNGSYKIALDNKEGIFVSEQKVYLKDKLTGIFTDLTIQDYIFNVNKGTDDNRFEIVYKSSEVLGTDVSSKSDFAVYRDGSSFVIKSSYVLGKIELYDVSGKLIIASSSIQKEFKLDASTLPTGVYLIRAENSGNIRTKKVIK